MRHTERVCVCERERERGRSVGVVGAYVHVWDRGESEAKRERDNVCALARAFACV